MKTIHFEIYKPDGTLLKSRWENAKFIDFTKKLNGGLGPCLIELGEAFDYQDETLTLNNEIQIWIEDKDTGSNGKLIYSGYISNIFRSIDEGEEKVLVNLLGYYTRLGQDIWKNGTTTTFNYSGSATDIGTIFRSLIDRYIAETINPKITYSKDTIKTTGTTTEFKFEFLTYREAIDILRSLAPSNWWWYVDEHGTIYFKSKTTSPIHNFISGKHFKSIRVERSMEKVKNAVFFYDDVGNLLKLYTDDGSVKDYGRRSIKIFNDRIGVATDADKIGESFVLEHKDPDIKIIAEIIDNNEDDQFGYDIESINPGDTCSFLGFDENLICLLQRLIINLIK